ncbi:MAG: short-chain dehydrogenase [Deltaproteobacteria bacterium RIFOXYA12_FULL_61_11]|nr:MAG: short-chain dehydrogenase [Deltaproteobacteria bacterium RIFOXYA12_FULL_61_11]
MPHLLVLGGTSDLGIAIAARFAENGFDLLLAARRVDEARRIASDLGLRTGRTVEVRPLDVLTIDRHAAWYRALQPRPDVVLCVIGELGDQDQALADPAEARRLLDTNLTGCVTLLDEAAAEFGARRTGSIIGVSSVAGERGRASNLFYGCAKAGFTAYLSGLRAKLHGSGVRVMTVLPGYVRTKMLAGFDPPALVTSTPDAVARDIWNAYCRGTDVLFTPWYWRPIMAAVRALPEALFKRLSL